jgi:pimeloyl-ACP methyl ester carboxylesterase
VKAYFFPGLGADESLAAFHPLPGHDVEWIRWPADPGRSWEDFATALLAANRIEPGAVLIGISLGGMAAQAVAERTRALGVILIGSCKTSKSVSNWLRPFHPLLGLAPEFLFDMRLMARAPAAWMFGVTAKAHVDLLFAMGSRLSPRQFKRANALALGFPGAANQGIPVFSIHGAADRIIPAAREPRDRIIPGGGHLISMTHADQVNRAILEWVGAIAASHQPGSQP